MAIMGGPAGPCLWTLITRASAEGVDSCRAFLFADQSRAFERVGLPGLRAVLQRWGLPTWLLRG
eukprot:6360833-Alexandrium_andersonii.AAC.1